MDLINYMHSQLINLFRLLKAESFKVKLFGKALLLVVLSSSVLAFSPAALSEEAAAREPQAVSAGAKNFRFGPLGLLIGALNLGLDFQTTPNWTVGPTLFYWNLNLDVAGGDATFTKLDVNAYSAGIRGTYFMSGVFNDGWYVSPAFSYNNVSASATDASGVKVDGKAPNFALQAIFGYGWFWQSFNMILGAGLTVPFGSGDITITDSNGNKESVPFARVGASAAEFTMGWTF